MTEIENRLHSILHCERLSSNIENFRLVDAFTNSRNDSLASALKNEAYDDDENGVIAYYVIKNTEGQIVFFFSLKTGLLYDQHIDEKTIKLMKKVNDFVQENLKSAEATDAQIRALNKFIEKIRSHKGITKEDLDALPNKNNTLLDDLQQELNNNITHVGKTYSAVELVHFCANDDTRDWWEELDIPYSLGIIIFWMFIVPIILDTRKLIGVQYLFLFAADLSDDRDLIKYYQDNLMFTLDEDRATVKPLYDLSCKFMYQETVNLSAQRDGFFDNFEPDEV